MLLRTMAPSPSLWGLERTFLTTSLGLENPETPSAADMIVVRRKKKRLLMNLPGNVLEDTRRSRFKRTVNSLRNTVERLRSWDFISEVARSPSVVMPVACKVSLSLSLSLSLSAYRHDYKEGQGPAAARLDLASPIFYWGGERY